MTTNPQDARLGRRHRLSDNREFDAVYSAGKRCAGKFMVMWALPGASGIRVGVVASRRQFARAHDRNRARRLMREAFRLGRSRFSGQWDVVLVARQRMRGVMRAEVDGELLELAGKLGLVVRQQ